MAFPRSIVDPKNAVSHPPRRPRAGQSLVEYALIIAVVAVVVIPAIDFTRGAFALAYQNQQAALQSAPGGPAATATPETEGEADATANVPTDPDQCKKGGWIDLTRDDGSTFKNQGDCQSYAQNGK
jgi:Flp pilus assembly pilin Flp